MYDGPPGAWQRDTCDASIAPKNGTVGDCDATLERGVECAPTCDVGFTVSGMSSCDANGVLAAATCESQCFASTFPSDGGIGNCPEFLDSGDTCQPSCDAGYAVTGPSTCDSGVLSPALCLDTSGPACDASAAPENGDIGDCTATLMSGTTCQPTCDAGFTVSRFSYCDGGEYTAATCSILPTSCETSPPANGAAGDCPPSGVLETDASCQPTCSPGYLASGVTSCELGVLTSTTCVAGPPPSPPPPPPSPPSPPSPPPPRNRLIADYDDSPAARLGCDVAARLLVFAAAVELICEFSR
jgi:hypothetical protein